MIGNPPPCEVVRHDDFAKDGTAHHDVGLSTTKVATNTKNIFVVFVAFVFSRLAPDPLVPGA